ncbi:unnamed protein product [Cyprideis torosa]|uniref:Uncharacterized protein n=1 Tax=Cyprideis torosa TaxID=163714 RepID=A0A7R8W8V6_9CRUS|nr:unnamed protein product [Cyprideis torosa]CAG0887893.1 unnamed protein product [Cyprideis torosa]
MKSFGEEQLGSLSVASPSPTSRSNASLPPSLSPDSSPSSLLLPSEATATAPAADPGQKVRVLYDFDAKSPDELSLLADEFIYVLVSPPVQEDDSDPSTPSTFSNSPPEGATVKKSPPPGYCLARRGQKTGFVPKAFLDMSSIKG